MRCDESRCTCYEDISRRITIMRCRCLHFQQQILQVHVLQAAAAATDQARLQKRVTDPTLGDKNSKPKNQTIQMMSDDHCQEAKFRWKNGKQITCKIWKRARSREWREEGEREREREGDGNEWCALWKLAIVCSLKRLTSHGVTFAWFSLDTDYPRPGTPPPVFKFFKILLFFYVSFPSVSAGIRTLGPPKNPHPGIILTTCGYQNIKIPGSDI